MPNWSNIVLFGSLLSAGSIIIYVHKKGEWERQVIRSTLRVIPLVFYLHGVAQKMRAAIIAEKERRRQERERRKALKAAAAANANSTAAAGSSSNSPTSS